MKQAITILVDERQHNSPYVIFGDTQGKHEFIESGNVSSAEELRNIQQKYEGSQVQIDGFFTGTEMREAAHFYKWKVIKFKSDDYPFIEAMTQFCNK